MVHLLGSASQLVDGRLGSKALLLRQLCCSDVILLCPGMMENQTPISWTEVQGEREWGEEASGEEYGARTEGQRGARKLAMQGWLGAGVFSCFSHMMTWLRSCLVTPSPDDRSSMSSGSFVGT